MRLLARIPLVMDIMSHADNGEPVAVVLENDPEAANAEARAFASLAANVVEAVDERNSTKAPTRKVEVK